MAAAINRLSVKMSLVKVAKNGYLFIFQFTHENLIRWVLDSGPWLIGKKLLIVQRWNPELSARNINLKKVPLWCILRNIPLHLYNSTCLSYIASSNGKPLSIDRGTMAQLHWDFATICIELDFEEEVPEYVEVEMGNGKVAEIVLPWVSEQCSKCRVFSITA